MERCFNSTTGRFPASTDSSSTSARKIHRSLFHFSVCSQRSGTSIIRVSPSASGSASTASLIPSLLSTTALSSGVSLQPPSPAAHAAATITDTIRHLFFLFILCRSFPNFPVQVAFYPDHIHVRIRIQENGHESRQMRTQKTLQPFHGLNCRKVSIIIPY